MPIPKGKPIMYQEVALKEIERCHRIYTRFPFLKKNYALVNEVPQGGVVMDIGCAEGTWLKRVSMMRKDLKLVGLDVCRYLEMIAPEELHRYIIADCSEKLPVDDESVDFVHCAHLIEHLQKPSTLIREVHRVLKKGGMLYLEAPDVRRIFLPSGIEGVCNFYDEPTHIRPYTREALRRLGLEAGFQAKDISVFYARNNFYLLSFPYTLVRYLITRHNLYLQSILQPIVGADVGGIFWKS